MARTQTVLNNSYSKSIETVIRDYNSDLENGIRISELESRYLKYGYNELPKIKKSVWKIYLAPIFNFLILILLVSAIIIAILGSIQSTIITFVVVIANSLTVIIQQYRAQKALESLRQIAALKATVIRDGIQFEIPNREIVPGDIIVLEQGDKIPADARLLEVINMTIEEAPLTGESEAVEKKVDIIEESDVLLQNQYNMVFMGTYVQTGRGKALVTGTGTNTEIGKISNQLNEMGSIEDIPLTRKLNRLGYILGIIVIINLIILIIFNLIMLANGTISGDVNDVLASSILRALNVLPINLPLLATLVLITGVLNMAQSGVIIKNLAAIESLGRVSVICTDKTGTITKNEMTVERFWINNKEYDVTGSGYDSEGQILNNGNSEALQDNITFRRFIDSSVVNNTAKLVFEDVKIKSKTQKEMAVRKALGSPSEAALIVVAEKAGYIPYDIKKNYEILKEFSFNSELKKMTTICKSLNGNEDIYAFSKGAPERMLEISNRIEINGAIEPFSDSMKNEILEKIKIRATQGYRTLVVAYKILENGSGLIRKEAENDLIFLSFLSILDPARPEVKKAVEECESGGIKIVMITGDHPATAKTIAAQMRIFKEGDLVVDSNDILSLSDEEFDKVTVFARVVPSDKEIIVRNYQKDNIVAMTGDGINDALALKLANAGIAMGVTGTDVAKETADMVISDDNFASIKKGVEIGRGLFSRIRTIIYFFIALNIMEAFIFFGYEFNIFFDLFATEWQHIYIFAIVHSLPALALVVDKFSRDLMKEPPRGDEELLSKNMWIMLLVQALIMGLGLVLVLEITLNGVIPLNDWNLNPDLSYIPPGSTLDDLTGMKARTMFITTLYIVETSFIWTFRRPNKPVIKSIREDFNLTLFLVLALTLGINVLVVMFSYPVNYFINDVIGLNFQLNFMFLSFTDWLVCIAFALPGLVGIEIYKYFARRRQVFF